MQPGINESESGEEQKIEYSKMKYSESLLLCLLRPGPSLPRPAAARTLSALQVIVTAVQLQVETHTVGFQVSRLLPEHAAAPIEFSPADAVTCFGSRDESGCEPARDHLTFPMNVVN